MKKFLIYCLGIALSMPLMSSACGGDKNDPEEIQKEKIPSTGSDISEREGKYGLNVTISGDFGETARAAFSVVTQTFSGQADLFGSDGKIVGELGTQTIRTFSYRGTAESGSSAWTTGKNSIYILYSGTFELTEDAAGGTLIWNMTKDGKEIGKGTKVLQPGMNDIVVNGAELFQEYLNK